MGNGCTPVTAMNTAKAMTNTVRPALARKAAIGSPDSRYKLARVPPQLGHGIPVSRSNGQRLGWWLSWSATHRVNGLASMTPAIVRRGVLAFTNHGGFCDVVPDALATWLYQDQDGTNKSGEATRD